MPELRSCLEYPPCTQSGPKIQDLDVVLNTEEMPPHRSLNSTDEIFDFTRIFERTFLLLFLETVQTIRHNYVVKWIDRTELIQTWVFLAQSLKPRAHQDLNATFMSFRF